jgi:hypothetical protein
LKVNLFPGIIQKGYVLNLFAGKFQETIIKEGSVCFCHRGDPATGAPQACIGGKFSADSVPHTIVSLSMMNQILQDEYDDAFYDLFTHEENTKGYTGPSLMEYLQKEEKQWTELFIDNGKKLRSNGPFKGYYYLCKEGML